MKNYRLTLCLFLTVFMLTTLCFSQETNVLIEKDFPNPERFEKDIKAFEEQDRLSSPPEHAIVAIGSSSLKIWNKTINEDLAPLTIIPRGFGGSTMYDALYYADRMVIPYKPRAVLLYEGDNDVAGGISPEKIKDTFLEFVDTIHHKLPDTRIYFLSIKPSPSRWSVWPGMREANRLIEKECAGDPRLTYVDIATPMLDADRQVLTDIFMSDRLHMNEKGYVIWRNVLRPILMKEELEFEPEPVPEIEAP